MAEGKSNLFHLYVMGKYLGRDARAEDVVFCCLHLERDGSNLKYKHLGIYTAVPIEMLPSIIVLPVAEEETNETFYEYLVTIRTSLFPGMSFQDLYQRCREAFLVNSDLTLNAQLTEFKDHKLIRCKQNFDGVEHLSIPVDSATLREFLEQQGDN